MRRMVLPHIPHRMVRNRISIIIWFLRCIPRIRKRRHPLVIPHQIRRIPETPRANDRPVKPVKPSLPRPIPPIRLRPRRRQLRHMPLPRHISPVTSRSQRLRNRHTPPTQFPAIPLVPPIIRHVPHPRLVRVQPRQQARPSRTTPRPIVKLREPHPLRRQPVQHRRPHLSTVAPQIRKPHVVTQHDHNVRPPSRALHPTTHRHHRRQHRNHLHAAHLARPIGPRKLRVHGSKSSSSMIQPPQQTRRHPLPSRHGE